MHGLLRAGKARHWGVSNHASWQLMELSGLCDARGMPRIFLSHGTNDTVMPIDATSRRFVPALEKLGYDVTYREYEGGHAVPEPVVRDAFTWFAR